MTGSKTEKRPRSSGRKKHAVRFSDGSIREIAYGRMLAIKLLCTECLGFEGNPKECTDVTCPLYPFRGKTRMTMVKE